MSGADLIRAAVMEPDVPCPWCGAPAERSCSWGPTHPERIIAAVLAALADMPAEQVAELTAADAAGIRAAAAARAAHTRTVLDEYQARRLHR